MPAPANRQEFPAPHRDWRGANEVDAPPQRAMSKIARLWAPLRAVLEPHFATLCRVALRVVDRTTGIPYSADELEAKILGQVAGTTYIEASELEFTALTTATPLTLASIVLTPGDWDLRGFIEYSASVATTNNRVSVISDTPDTIIGQAQAEFQFWPSVSNSISASSVLPTFRRNVTETTTYYLVAYSEFESGNVLVAGTISARRFGPAV